MHKAAEIIEIISHAYTHMVNMGVRYWGTAPRLEATGAIAHEIVPLMRLVDFVHHIDHCNKAKSWSCKARDWSGIAYGSLLVAGYLHRGASWAGFPLRGDWIRSLRRVAYLSHLGACVWHSGRKEGGKHTLAAFGAAGDFTCHLLEWYVTDHGWVPDCIGLVGHGLMGASLWLS